MTKLFFTVISLMLLLVSNVSAGQSGEYIGVSSGILLTRNSSINDQNGATANLTYDNIGIPVSTFMGHQFGVGLRVEEELFYKSTTANEFSYSGTTRKIGSNMWCIGAMTNLYYDWFHDVKLMEGSSFSPYVGLGIGFADVNMSEGAVNGIKLWNSDNDLVPAYQIAIGSGIPIRKNLSLDISYRYFGTGNINIDHVKANYSNQNVLLGVRYLFSK